MTKKNTLGQRLFFACALLSLAVVAVPNALKTSAASINKYTYDFNGEDFLHNNGSGTGTITNYGVVAKTEENRTFAYFDNDAYLELPSDFLASGTVTISMDIRPESTGDFQKILTYAESQDRYLQIAIRTGGSDETVNVEAGLKGNGEEFVAWGNRAWNALQVNVWQNLTLAINDDYINVYVNGEPLMEKKSLYPLSELLATNPTNLFIGKSLWSDPYFKGGIDNLVVYDKYLTEPEIALLNGINGKDVDINEGLSVYYSFDNSEDLKVDNSGNNNNFVLLSGTSSEDGKNGKAIELGNDKYGVLPEFMDKNSDEMSFSAWIKPTANLDYMKVIDLGRDTELWFQIALRNYNTDGKHLHIQCDMRYNGVEANIWGSSAHNAIEIGVWNHVALTIHKAYDTGYAKLFVNGEVVVSGQFPTSLSTFLNSSADSQTANYLGKSHYQDNLYTGFIDEICFYNRELNVTEVATLAKGNLPTKKTTGGSEVPPEEPEIGEQDITTGLTHYYSYDNANCVNLENNGSGDDLVVIGEADAFAKSGNSLNLNGGYAQLPSNVISTTSNKFSFATWIYPTTNGDWQKILDLGRGQDHYFQFCLRTGSSGSMHIQASIVMSGIESHVYGGTAFDAVRLNQWSHVALSVDGKDVKIYVNGSVVKTGTFNNSIADFVSAPNSQNTNYLGNSHFNDPTLVGYVDESVFYDIALNDNQVKYLSLGHLPQKQVTEKSGENEGDYDVLSDLFAYYSFDESNVGIDVSGNKNNALISRKEIETGNENKAGSNLGNYMIFNGRNDFLITPTNTIPKEDSQFTYASWVYFKSLNEFIRIFDFGTSSSYFDFRIRGNGVLETTLTDSNTEGETIVRSKQGAVRLNEWLHIALTVDGSNVTIYVNGQTVGVGKFVRNLNTFYSIKNIINEKQNFIGLSRYAQDEKFSGYMDEIRIYFRALSAQDVSYLATGAKAAVENPEISEEVKVNGSENDVECISNKDASIKDVAGEFVIESEMKVSDFVAKFTLIQDAKIEVVDNFDFKISDSSNVVDGSFVKIYYRNIILKRVRVNVGKFFEVKFDSDGGEAVKNRVVREGEEIALPYITKGGYSLLEWKDGATALGEKVTINSNKTFKANYVEKEYTIIFDLHDGNYEMSKARYNQQITLTNFGNEKIVGFRYNGQAYSLGSFTMPSRSIVLKAIYNMQGLDVNDVSATTYHGSFEVNGKYYTSTTGYSLALLDDIEIDSGIIEITMNANNANDIGLLFWVDENIRTSFWEDAPSNYYIALINWEGWLVISKVNYGQTWTPVISYKLPSYQINHDYVVKVVLSDNEVDFYVDGVCYLNYKDSEDHNGSRVGFRSTNSGVTFKVTDLESEDK